MLGGDKKYVMLASHISRRSEGHANEHEWSINTTERTQQTFPCVVVSFRTFSSHICCDKNWYFMTRCWDISESHQWYQSWIFLTGWLTEEKPLFMMAFLHWAWNPWIFWMSQLVFVVTKADSFNEMLEHFRVT